MNVIKKFEVGKTYGDKCGDKFTVVKRTAKMAVFEIVSHNPETGETIKEVRRLKIHYRFHSHENDDMVEEIKPYGQFGFSVFPDEI